MNKKVQQDFSKRIKHQSMVKKVMPQPKTQPDILMIKPKKKFEFKLPEQTERSFNPQPQEINPHKIYHGPEFMKRSMIEEDKLQIKAKRAQRKVLSMSNAMSFDEIEIPEESNNNVQAARSSITKSKAVSMTHKVRMQKKAYGSLVSQFNRGEKVILEDEPKKIHLSGFTTLKRNTSLPSLKYTSNPKKRERTGQSSVFPEDFPPTNQSKRKSNQKFFRNDPFLSTLAKNMENSQTDIEKMEKKI